MVLLPEAVDVSKKQISEWIARSCACKRRIESQVTGYRASCQFTTKLVLLRCHDIRPELKVVFPHDLGYVVAIGVGGIGIVRAIRDIAGILAKALIVRVASDQIDSGQNVGCV